MDFAAAVVPGSMQMYQRRHKRKFCRGGKCVVQLIDWMNQFGRHAYSSFFFQSCHVRIRVCVLDENHKCEKMVVLADQGMDLGVRNNVR